MEVWRDIKGYEGLYQVSNFGRVKSLGRVAGHWRGGERFYKESIKKYHLTRGYRIVSMTDANGHSRRLKIHRLVAGAFVDGYFKGAHVNHIDGNKANNKPSNLEWVTGLENMQHAKEHELVSKGRNHFRSKYVLNTLTGVFYDNIREASEFSKYSYPYFKNMVNGTQRENVTNCILV